MRFPFCGQSYSSQSAFVDHQRTVNLYPELTESGAATNRVVLYPTPGFYSFCNFPTRPVRALFHNNNRTFAVVGATLYEVWDTKAFVSRGTVLNDGQPATISTNGEAGGQLWITSGGAGYIYTLATDTLSAALAYDAHLGGFSDGYFLKLDTTTSSLYLSALEDGTSWDAGDVAQRNTTPDKWKSFIVSHRDIWLFGAHKTDVFYNSGDTFPYVPYPGASIEHGIVAPFSAATCDNTVFWLRSNDQGDGIVYRAQGYVPMRVSHHALEYALHGYTTISDAVAFAYQDQGHSFYVLSFPSAGKTWVYDAATNLWHERAHYNAATGEFEIWPARFHTFAWGKHLVGDGINGALYQMSVDRHRDADGSIIRRMRQAPHIIGQHQWLFYSRAELLLEVGVGSSEVRNPQVGLQWSDDSGLTWSTVQYVSAGMAGQRQARAVWRRLGQSRDRIFRVVMQDGVPWRIIDLIVDVEPGMH